MAITLIGSAAATNNGVSSTTITVPTGVTTSHLGILFLTTDNAGTVTYTVTGSWTNRVQNPTGQNNEEVSIYTKLGGFTAGDTFTITPSLSRNIQITAVWVNTGGQDISIVGSVGTRNGTSVATITIPAVTTTVANSEILVLATERTTATGTTISSWSPSAPTQLYFLENNTPSTTHYVGTFTQATAGSTGTRTPTFNSASGNGTGVMFVVPPSASTVTGSGTASAAFNATGTTSTQTKQGAGSASAAFSASGAGSQVASGAGSASASTSASGSGSVSLAGGGAGSASTGATGQGIVTVVGDGSGSADFNAINVGVVSIIDSGGGSGSAEFDATGDGDIGFTFSSSYGYATLTPNNGTADLTFDEGIAPLDTDGISTASLKTDNGDSALLSDGTSTAELTFLPGEAQLIDSSGQAVVNTGV